MKLTLNRTGLMYYFTTETGLRSIPLVGSFMSIGLVPYIYRCGKAYLVMANDVTHAFIGELTELGKDIWLPDYDHRRLDPHFPPASPEVVAAEGEKRRPWIVRFPEWDGVVSVTVLAKGKVEAVATAHRCLTCETLDKEMLDVLNSVLSFQVEECHETVE